jgi:hypothetical protein
MHILQVLLTVASYCSFLLFLFTGRQLEVDRIGSTTDESSYVIGSFKSDSFSTGFDLTSSLNDIKQQLFTQRSNLISEMSPLNENTQNGVDHKQKVQNTINEDVKSPLKEIISPISIDNKIVNRHKQQSEKAKELIAKFKLENGNAVDVAEEERQTRLREHAKRLIAETRSKSSSLDSPTSPLRSITQRITMSPERTISPINNNVQPFSFNASMPNEEVSRDQSPKKSSPRGKSPLNNLLDRISPKTETKLEKTKYIQSELDALGEIGKFIYF